MGGKERDMGLSFGRSVKLGPLRVSASTWGIGASAGVKGARVSVGPRGTYVTLGRGGFRYQTKLKGATPAPRRMPEFRSTPPKLEQGMIQTASALELAEASPHAVLEDIQKRVHRFNWFKLYATVTTILSVPFLAAPPAFLFVAFLFGVPGFFIYRWNRDRRTARLYYDIDNYALIERLALCNAIGETLSRTASLWHIYFSKETTDKKRNAGAGALVGRTPTSSHPGSLPGIELNIEPWSITVGPQQLLFLPDRLIVHENGQFAAVAYGELTAEFSPIQFIETEKIPTDSRKVGVTWRYVNKSGGPDRRFNNNRQLPILEYGRLTLTTQAGMTIILQSSREDATRKAQELLSMLRDLDRQGYVRPEPTAPQQYAPSLPASPSDEPPGLFQDSDLILRSAATLLKFIAAADRRISDEEISRAAALLARLSSDPVEVVELIAHFKSLPASDADARSALLILSQGAPSLLPQLLEGATSIASADGRITPKEQERLSLLTGWAESVTQVSA